MDCEEITHDKAILTSSGHSSYLETFTVNRKYYFRLSLPVNSAFKISFPVSADITIRSDIKFEGESLEAFSGYDHVKHRIMTY